MKENSGCELRGYRIDCSGGEPQNHHLISRGALQKATAAKKYCEKEHPEIFIRKICAAHNTSRVADTKWARRVLLRQSKEIFGIEYVKSIVNGIPFKVPRPEMSYKGIMAAPLPPED